MKAIIFENASLIITEVNIFWKRSFILEGEVVKIALCFIYSVENQKLNTSCSAGRDKAIVYKINSERPNLHTNNIECFEKCMQYYWFKTETQRFYVSIHFFRFNQKEMSFPSLEKIDFLFIDNTVGNKILERQKGDRNPPK